MNSDDEDVSPSSALLRLQVEGDIQSNLNKPLATAAAYYLSYNSISLRKEALKHLFLFFVCVSGASLYVDPAKAYAKRFDQEKNAWRYIAATCVPSLVVLYVATDTFFKMHASTRVPSILKRQLRTQQTVVQGIVEYALIFLIALVSSVPLVVVYYQYHLKDRLKFTIAMMAIILIDNTFLHFLPVKLALSHPIYRFPFLPIEYCVIKTCCSAKDLPSNSDELSKMQRAIAMRLRLVMKRLERESFTRKGCGYDVRMPQTLCQIKTLEALIEHIPELPADADVIRLQKSPLIILKLIGAIWIWTCCVGYYAATYNQCYSLTTDDNNRTAHDSHQRRNHSDLTGSAGKAVACSFLPIYTLSVLLFFFGVTFVGGMYDYFSTWGKGVVKIPMEVKLYPIAFLLFMIVNVLCLPYCFAASVELIYSDLTYDWVQPVQPLFVYSAMSGIIFVSFCAVRDFFMLMSRKFATHFGSEDKKQFIRLYEGFEHWIVSLQSMQYPHLLTEKSKMSEGMQKKLGLFSVSDISALPRPRRTNTSEASSF